VTDGQRDRPLEITGSKIVRFALKIYVTSSENDNIMLKGTTTIASTAYSSSTLIITAVTRYGNV